MKDFLRRVFDGLRRLFRGRATHLVEVELHELEALFGWTVCAPLVGIPVPAPALTFRLLPYLEPEVRAFLARASLHNDALARLAAYFDLG